jgi:hypothetical protein
MSSLAAHPSQLLSCATDIPSPALRTKPQSRDDSPLAELAAPLDIQALIEALQQRARQPDPEPAVAVRQESVSASALDEMDAPGHLVCISANVQKSRENTVHLLETHLDADIVLVQECFYGYIKHVVSSTQSDGDEYRETVSHRNFSCLRIAGDKARVAVYIHRRWAHTSPSIRTSLVSHRDILCITMQFSNKEFTFLNVYNESGTSAAVEHLINRVHHLPPIAFMAGDFNLRHSKWDRGERPSEDAPEPERARRRRARHQAHSEQLIALAEMHLALQLLNNENGPPTWISHNEVMPPGVLDLVWVDPDLGEYSDLVILEHE